MSDVIDDAPDGSELSWIVENRYLNHKSSLEVYDLIRQYQEIFTGRNGKGYRSTANILLGIAFSLWRAVFLTNIKRERTSLIQDTEGFLKELIDSNTITFAIDRNYKDWSFRYYMSNADYRLKTLSSKFKKQGYHFEAPTSTKNKTPRQEWLDAQSSLNEAIKSFRQLLGEAYARKAFAHVKLPKRKPKGTAVKTNG